MTITSRKHLVAWLFKIALAASVLTFVIVTASFTTREAHPKAIVGVWERTEKAQKWRIELRPTGEFEYRFMNLPTLVIVGKWYVNDNMLFFVENEPKTWKQILRNPRLVLRPDNVSQLCIVHVDADELTMETRVAKYTQEEKWMRYKQ